MFLSHDDCSIWMENLILVRVILPVTWYMNAHRKVPPEQFPFDMKRVKRSDDEENPSQKKTLCEEFFYVTWVTHPLSGATEKFMSMEGGDFSTCKEPSTRKVYSAHQQVS